MRDLPGLPRYAVIADTGLPWPSSGEMLHAEA